MKLLDASQRHYICEKKEMTLYTGRQSNRMRRICTVAIVGCRIVFASLAFSLPIGLAMPALATNSDEEVRLGKEAAAEVEKQYKFVTDEAIVKRVTEIGKEVAASALRTRVRPIYGSAAPANFDYSFKVIDDADVNAFALPGGYVYVCKGLLDYVQSDDELAAVIAHEIAHVDHHHAMELRKTQQKAMLGMAAAIIAGAAAGVQGNDLGELAYAANLVTIAKMSAYGQKAEADADRSAVAYLAGTKYNPVAALTLMERLAREEGRKPAINWGIFANHPPAYQRAREVLAELEQRGIPINRRLVTTYMRAEVKPVELDGVQAADVVISGVPIIRLADSEGRKASARAEFVAGKIETALLAGANLHQIKVEGGGRFVTMRGEVVVAPTQDDAELAGKSIPDLTSDAAKALKRVLWRELFDQAY